MSLKDDMLRNRRVFELLAGAGENEGAEVTRQVKSGFAAPFDGDEPRGRTGFSLSGMAADTAGEAPQISRARGFSLNYGTVDLPPGFMELPGASAVNYPETGTEPSYTAARSNPLEAMYGQIELEARMVSQLSREGDSFGF